MLYTRKIIIKAALSVLLMVAPFALIASHVVGGGFVYRYLGDTVIGGIAQGKYEVSLYIYQDCISGVPDAIAQDNPAFITVYRSDGTLFRVDTNIYYDANPASGGAIEVPAEIETVCGKIMTTATTCLLRKRFTKTYYLPADNYGYTIVNQRCCRSSSIANINKPEERGVTFFCEIPAGTAGKNSSAVFTKHPTQIMCINSTNIVDESATDADGDSLSYEMDVLYDGASGPDIKPKVSNPPPYISVEYQAGHSANLPMGPNGEVTIDGRTGVLTVNANIMGVYQIAVLCKEWRGGQIINTVRRELTWSVLDCALISEYRPQGGGNRTVIAGDTLQFHAENGVKYTWQPGTFLSNANIADPVGTFTTPGEYTYELYGESKNGCKGKDIIKVKVLEHAEYTAPNAFTPNGDGVNDVLLPIGMKNTQFKNMRVFNRWGNVLFFSTQSWMGWDGKHKDRPQDQAVYVWQIEYTDSFGQPRVASGSTILLR